MYLRDDFEEATSRLIAAVILQAIKDWVALDYGRIKALRINSKKVSRREVYLFLTSPEFEAMMKHICPGTTQETVRETLHLWEDENDYL